MHRIDALAEACRCARLRRRIFETRLTSGECMASSFVEPRTCRAPPRFSSLSSTMKSGCAARWSNELSISFRIACSGGNPSRLSLRSWVADFLIDPFQHRQIERVLVAEIMIDELLVDAGARRDLVDPGAGEPAAGEFAPRRRQQLAAAWRPDRAAAASCRWIVFQAFPTRQLTIRPVPCCIGSGRGRATTRPSAANEESCHERLEDCGTGARASRLPGRRLPCLPLPPSPSI